MTENSRTNGRRDRFIELLAESGNVQLACRGAGLPRTTAYNWRGDDGEFARRWDEAKFKASCPLLGDDWEQALRKQRKRSDPRYVYLIRDGWRGLIKIGVARNVEKRFRDLQNSCPQRLVIVGIIHSESAMKLERKLHMQFADKHYRGEWFELTDSDISSVLERYG